MKEGWRKELLKNVTIFKSGKTVSKNIEKDYGEVIYAKVGDMNLEGNEKEINASSIYVNFEDISESQIIPIGSIIFPKRGGAIATNKKRLIIQPTIVDLNTMALVPSNEILSDYLYFWFLTIDLNELSNGTSVPQINNYSFDNIYLSFPESIEEQKQIVAILDKAFAAIDQAQANIEKNIENAKELFQSKLNEIFSRDNGKLKMDNSQFKDGSAKGTDKWEEKRLGEVVKIIGGGTPSKKVKDYYNGNIPWATVRDMNCDELSETDLTITEEGLKNSSSNIIPEGEIIVATRVGLGKVCLLNQATAINQDLKGLIPINKDLNREFLFFWYKSIADKVEKDGVGMTVKGVNLNYVKALKIHIPEINVQENIVSICKDLKGNTEAIDTHYQQKLTNLEDLKKSILQKAFSGQLTMDNEELIVNENPINT